MILNVIPDVITHICQGLVYINYCCFRMITSCARTSPWSFPSWRSNNVSMCWPLTKPAGCQCTSLFKAWALLVATTCLETIILCMTWTIGQSVIRLHWQHSVSLLGSAEVTQTHLCSTATWSQCPCGAARAASSSGQGFWKVSICFNMFQYISVVLIIV